MHNSREKLAGSRLAKRVIAALAGFLLSGSLVVGAVVGGLFDQVTAGSAAQEPGAAQPAGQGASPAAGAAGAAGTPGAPSASAFSYAAAPAYAGAASVQVNGDVPFFTAEDIQYAQNNLGYECYGAQDSLSRCSFASACVGKETMPAAGEKRGDIGPVKPSGWQTARYESVEGGYLYNRCHLLAWQLTDENANVDNLITGTRSMNTVGMIKYEDIVAGYLRATGNHVLYRVTPLFVENELVARGVLMEARSVEDDGAGVCFCVWAYNVQPGVAIDYRDGSSTKVALSMEMSLAADAAAAGGSDDSGGVSSESEQAQTYVLNTRSHKFHAPDCNQVESIKDTNKSQVTATRSEVIAQGYSPCARCNP